ncbi:hypothetical protein I3271_00085 [Photobacterium leiognathi]|uniref:hypothetical protein n=1 Tax=Photobacterium leiognathi TaxID=553611 RepID=UPI001EE137B5|nr:hypothetical protein [Photobacterium leiognathi]MCG3883088.1 hypothetical protein [Photobacterium leiognathi]
MDKIMKGVLALSLLLASSSALAESDFYKNYKENYVKPESVEVTQARTIDEVSDNANWVSYYHSSTGTSDTVLLPDNYSLANVTYSASGLGVFSALMSKTTNSTLGLELDSQELGERECRKTGYKYQCNAELGGSYVKGCSSEYVYEVFKYNKTKGVCEPSKSSTPVEVKILSVNILK